MAFSSDALAPALPLELKPQGLEHVGVAAMCRGDAGRIERISLDDRGALISRVGDRTFQQGVRDVLMAPMPSDEEAEYGPGRRLRRRHPGHGPGPFEASVSLARRDGTPPNWFSTVARQQADGSTGINELQHGSLLFRLARFPPVAQTMQGAPAVMRATLRPEETGECFPILVRNGSNRNPLAHVSKIAISTPAQ